MDGWTDRRTDGWTDERMDGCAMQQCPHLAPVVQCLADRATGKHSDSRARTKARDDGCGGCRRQVVLQLEIVVQITMIMLKWEGAGQGLREGRGTREAGRSDEMGKTVRASV
eukprot:352958-Chlamydomonas_euryale.AAC.4